MIKHINYTNSFGKTTLQNSFCKMTLHNPICKMDLQIELTNPFCQTVLQNGLPLFHFTTVKRNEPTAAQADPSRHAPRATPRPRKARQAGKAGRAGSWKLEPICKLEAGQRKASWNREAKLMRGHAANLHTYHVILPTANRQHSPCRATKGTSKRGSVTRAEAKPSRQEGRNEPK